MKRSLEKIAGFGGGYIVKSVKVFLAPFRFCVARAIHG